MSDDKKPFGLQGVHITHPGERDRNAGAKSKVWLGITRPSGSVIEVPLSEDELVRLIAGASNLLNVLYEVRRRRAAVKA